MNRTNTTKWRYFGFLWESIRADYFAKHGRKDESSFCLELAAQHKAKLKKMEEEEVDFK